MSRFAPYQKPVPRCRWGECPHEPYCGPWRDPQAARRSLAPPAAGKLARGWALFVIVSAILLTPFLLPAQDMGVQLPEGHEPGLMQTLRNPDFPSAPRDVRVARLPALYVEPGTPASPFLEPGPIESTWEGFINLKINDSYVFKAEGRGKLKLEINGVAALEREGPDLAAGVSGEVDMKKGPNPIRLEYESPAESAAQLRLFWWNSQQPREPIAPQVLSHLTDDPGLQDGLKLRRGRQLFASGRCASCHRPNEAWPESKMPELDGDSPALDAAGTRFQTAWIADWLIQPRAIRPDARMPRMLHGEEAVVAQDARDIAAFLVSSSLENPDSFSAPDLSEPALIEYGAVLHQMLGCATCHLLPGDVTLEDETRMSLENVRAKWKPGALVAFLRDPGRDFRWIRMPDFRLDEDEATSLAAYLFSRTQKPDAARAAADSERGRERVTALGCVNCHTLGELKSTLAAPSLARLATSTEPQGCLAESVTDRPHPVYDWDPDDRAALLAFLNSGLPSLGRRTWSEFSRRQFPELRCTACHTHDRQGDLWTRVVKPVVAVDDYGDDYEEEDDLIDDYGDFTEDSGADAPGGETGGYIHSGRPLLTWAGEKLNPDWLESCLAGTLAYKPRERLPARMPAFPAYAHGLALGLAQEHGMPPVRESRPPVDNNLLASARTLIEIDKLGCASCHAVGDQPALTGATSEAINFQHIPDRLTRGYYDRFVLDPPRLLPGIMMPRFIDADGKTPYTALWDGDAKKQFHAIWELMRSLMAE